MKFVETFLVLLPILASKEVNAGCSGCEETLNGTIFEEHSINNGPCFLQRSRPHCITKGKRSILLCDKDDVLCKLTNKTVEDCGSPSMSQDGLGFHGGSPGQCSSTITINDDCKADTDYYKCMFGGTHTMAKYGCGSGFSCKNVCSYGFASQSEIDSIVNKHNELRAKVANCQESRAFNTASPQPCARNMNKLRWDPELAKVAQRSVQACNGGRGKNNAIYGYSNVVQNYGASWNSFLNL